MFLWFCLYQLHHQKQNMVESQIRERREPQENPTGHIRVSCSFPAFNQESFLLDGHGCCAAALMHYFCLSSSKKYSFSNTSFINQLLQRCLDIRGFYSVTFYFYSNNPYQCGLKWQPKLLLIVKPANYIPVVFLFYLSGLECILIGNVISTVTSKQWQKRWW